MAHPPSTRLRVTARALPLLALLAAVPGLPSVARAEPLPPPLDDTRSLADASAAAAPARLHTSDLVAFPYVKPQEKHYLRGALEILTVYGIGLVDYLLNTSARGGHLLPGDKAWDLHYDWPTFRSKLTGENYHLDTNRFNTNYISHPFAGTLYYTAARSGHLSVAESSLYAVVGGFLWEYFGEFREEVSINDVIVTPFAGIAIGETMMQIGGFFRRGRKNAANDVLATLFAPVRSVNDWAEGADPLRSADVDDLGLARDEWHRFDLFAGAGVTWQRSEARGRPVEAYADTYVGVDLRTANLEGYGGAARRSYLFDDGNAAHLRFEATLSRGRLADALFVTDFMPVGYYWREATVDAAGRSHGEGVLVGMRTAFEYEVHDQHRDRVRQRPIDVVAIVSPVGLTLEYARDAGRLRLRSRFEMGGALAGIQSFALDDYRQAHAGDDTNLQTVLVQQGYYHSLGVTVSPSVSVAWGDVEVGGRVRLDSYRGIQGYDEQQAKIAKEIALADRRVLLGAWAEVRVPGTRLVLGAAAHHRARMGDVGEVRASQSESSLVASVGLRL